MPKGNILRIQCLTSAIVRWSADNWLTTQDVTTLDSGVGIHFADLQTSEDVAFAQWVTVWQSVMKRSLAQMDRTRGKRPQPNAR